MSYAGACLDIGVTMLAACASWQATVEAESALASRSWIVRQAGGGPTGTAVDGTAINLEQTYALVRLAGPLSTAYAGPGSHDVSGALDIEIRIPRRETGETDADAADRATDTASAIAEELRAQVGAAGGFFVADVNTDPVDAIDPDQGTPCWRLVITIDFQG